MPRTKRALDEVDGNISSAPAPKRTSKGKAASKRTNVPTEKVIQESGIDERVNGEGNATDYDHGEDDNLDNTADTLAETIAHLNKAPDTDEAQRMQILDEDDSTWMCFCRSKSDKQRQHPELSPDQIEAHPGGSWKCMCGRYADRNPEHKWIMTVKGANILGDAVQQVACRDQDYIGVYMFNKWSAYAMSEVIENMLAAFNKALKTPADYMTIWSHTEALARFLHTDYMDPYHGNYPSENAKRLMLIGTALLSTIDVLIRHNHFHSLPNAEVRNIGLILCHYLHFGQTWAERCNANEAGWMNVVIRKVQEYGICIEGFYGIHNIIEKILAATNPQDSDVGKVSKLNIIQSYESAPPLSGLITMESLRAHKEGGTRRDWRWWDMKKEVSAYRRHVMVKVGLGGVEEYGGSGIGGKFYDLTAERNRGLVRGRRREVGKRGREGEVEREEEVESE